MPKLFVAVFVVLVLSLVTAGARVPAGAQEAIAVTSEEARNEFPAGVSFNVSFTAPAETEEVRLRYELAPDGTGASAVAQCTGTTTTTCSYMLASGRGIFIIPGAEITYHWEIEDADGNTLSTPEKLYVHEDTRFQFETISEGNVTLYYHDRDEERAREALAAAVDTLRDIGDLEQTQVTFPIKIFFYEDVDEMQPAIVASGAGRGVRVLGERVYSNTVMVAADVSPIAITRHEVAHIVTEEAVDGPFGVPVWMDEGVATYAQNEQLDLDDAALNAAIRADRVLTLAQLSSSATRGNQSTVSLFYGQSGSIVAFLVEEYGREKFAELLRIFKAGAAPDDAFQRAYGLDQLGIENAWRESVGLDPRAAAEPTPTAIPTEEVRAQPTASTGSGASASSDSDDDSAWSAQGMLTIAVLVLGVLAVGAAGVNLARQRF